MREKKNQIPKMRIFFACSRNSKETSLSRIDLKGEVLEERDQLRLQLRQLTQAPKGFYSEGDHRGLCKERTVSHVCYKRTIEPIALRTDYG